MKSILQETWKNFKQFCRANRTAILAAALFAVLCFGFMLTHYTLTIDEETWIQNTDPNLIQNIWMLQGRFGLYFFDRIFVPLGTYVPIVWDLVAVLLWTASGTLLAFAVAQVYDNVCPFQVFVFIGMFVSIPLVVGELLSFSMFNLQQALAMTFCALSALFLYLFLQQRKKACLYISSFLLFAATSFYQAFACVYVVVVAIYVFSRVLQEGMQKIGLVVKDVCYSAGAFFVAVGFYFVMNEILTTCFAPGGEGYLLDGFIGWGKGTFWDTAVRAVLNMGRIMLGVQLAGKIALGGVTVLFLSGLVWMAVRRKGWKNRAALLLAGGIVMISPYMMSLVLGMPTLIGRAYLGLPLALAFEMTALLREAKKIRWTHCVVVLLAVSFLLSNAYEMNRLFYNSYSTYQEDRKDSAQIIGQMTELGYDYREKPVVFIGGMGKEPREPKSPATSSFFSYDGGNNKRIWDFLRAEGYAVQQATEAQITQCVQDAQEKPCWPAHGSIWKTEECIAVKLSEPSELWYEVNGVDR